MQLSRQGHLQEAKRYFDLAIRCERVASWAFNRVGGTGSHYSSGIDAKFFGHAKEFYRRCENHVAKAKELKLRGQQ